MPTPAELRAEVRRTRKEWEDKWLSWMAADDSTTYEATVALWGSAEDALADYHGALLAARHLGPDPVEEAFERYRENVVAFGRECCDDDAVWALDAAILAEQREGA